MTGKLTDRASGRRSTTNRGITPEGAARGLASLCLLGTAATAAAVAAASLFACTEPAKRPLVHVRIDADTSVRELVDEVQVVVETQYPTGGGWLMTVPPRRFEPKVSEGWPLEFTDDPRGAKLSYQVTATARDERGAVVAQARALRDSNAANANNIFLHFEAACLRRTELCGKGETCHAGECIGAHYAASRDAVNTVSEPLPVATMDPDTGGPKLASEGEACALEGALACTGEGSRTPLRCDAGSWHTASICGEDELCDTTPGSGRGSCRQVASECRGRAPDVAFCDREEMRVCSSSFKSDVRPCGANEHCVASTEARCECLTGFVKGLAGCERPSDCQVENGGCDVLTTCAMRGAERECDACPPGYVGRGETGCEPLLAGLTPTGTALIPPFDPNVHSYRLKVSLLSQRVMLSPNAPSAKRIELNGTTVASGEVWTTPTLPLGEYPVKLTLTSSSGAASDYDVIVERTGTQTAYVKASNVGDSDNFGIGVALSGDTLVVGSLGEDSAAKAVNGDQRDNSAAEAGAAYVFVRRGNTWEQQAYLKPSDTAPGDFFGTRVAIERDTIVIGAIRTDLSFLNVRPNRPGAAYVFTRTGGTWTQTARLSSEPAAAGDTFGGCVSISGDTLAIGAPGESGGGATYVFTRSGLEWKLQAKLKPEGSPADVWFGYSVSLSNNSLIVAAPNDGAQANGAGSAYVYARTGPSWALERQLLPQPASAGATFGYAVAIRGDQALVGAPRIASITGPTVTTPGEVFAYRRADGAWTQSEVLKAILPRSSDSFGSSVALIEGAVLVGACGDSSGAQGVGADPARLDAGYAGAGYLFARESDHWKVSAYLKASNAGVYDSFGFGAALSEDTAVLSAIWERSKSPGVNGDAEDDSLNAPGAVYVFQ